MRHGLFLSCLFAVLALWTRPVLADQGDAVNPTELCDGAGCSEPMLNIVKAYSEGFGGFANQDITGYSGKCFHMNSMYDPNYAHFGAFTFERANEGTVITGLFGFFYDSDPYSGMSAAEMKSAFKAGGSNGSLGITRADHTELVYKYPASELRYWFRSNKSRNVLFLIGRMTDGNHGISSMVFCKMLRH